MNHLALGQIETYAPYVRVLPFGRTVKSMQQVPNGTTGEGVKVYQWVINSLTAERLFLAPIENARQVVFHRARVSLGLA